MLFESELPLGGSYYNRCLYGTVGGDSEAPHCVGTLGIPVGHGPPRPKRASPLMCLVVEWIRTRRVVGEKNGPNTATGPTSRIVSWRRALLVCKYGAGRSDSAVWGTTSSPNWSHLVIRLSPVKSLWYVVRAVAKRSCGDIVPIALNTVPLVVAQGLLGHRLMPKVVCRRA
jgi:hypothetical protein